MIVTRRESTVKLGGPAFKNEHDCGNIWLART